MRQLKNYKELNDKISNIIKESLDNFLNNIIAESHSSILYHFTNLENMASIAYNNSIKTSDEETEYNYKGLNAISLTRNGNPKEGFPHMAWARYSAYGNEPCVRITFDGYKLKTHSNFKDNDNIQHNIKTKPFDWTYNDLKQSRNKRIIKNDSAENYDNGKEWMLNANDYVDDMYNTLYGEWMTDKKAHPYSQAEDRLYTDADYIPNIAKYITNIDVFTNYPKFSKEQKEYLNTIKQYCEEYNIKFKIINTN